MDVVPAFIAVDGVKFPLSVSPAGVGLANDAAYPGLDALAYVVGYLISKRAGPGGVPELEARAPIARSQALSASPVTASDLGDLGGDVANWTRLAGAPPDLSDAYSVGTTFLTHGLVVPRRTLIAVVQRVGALHDAVVAHQLEARIEGVPEAGPVSLPSELKRAASEHDDDGNGADDRGADDRGAADGAASAAAPGSGTTREAAAPGSGTTRQAAAPASGTMSHAVAQVVAPAPTSVSPTGVASDDLLREIEAVAGQVDELDAAARQGSEPYASADRNAAAAARRHRLFIELEVAGLLAPAFADQARGTLARLGLTRLLGYVDATHALARYLVSVERAARFPGQAPPAALAAQVSIDWFRTPSGYHPDDVTEHEWLALCERNFASPLPASSVGSRFVRLCGAMHRLRYRPEVGAAPRLWRAELAT